MDIVTLISLILGFAALIVAFALEGGHMAALLQPTAALIVFGGLLGAVGVSFPGSVLKNIPKIILKAFSAKKQDRNEILQTFMKLSEVARKEGLLSLEQQVEELEMNDFTKIGLRLVIDGADEEVIAQALETRIENMEYRHEKGIAVFEAAGGYAPTMGVIGTVMGLVHVLGDLSNPEELGGKIAVAFIATLYGVGSANLMFLPIANKLKEMNADEVISYNMSLEGIQLLRCGSNPAFMREQLKGYLEHEESEKTEEGE
ncbi:MAG: flagellar motor protein MotA [Herbinix sp.]|jgi:chemotaxis protein MotA|nr:flagellar motor protein MotA [Herbinix sp.]